jgi:hypothetical protein
MSLNQSGETKLEGDLASCFFFFFPPLFFPLEKHREGQEMVQALCRSARGGGQRGGGHALGGGGGGGHALGGRVVVSARSARERGKRRAEGVCRRERGKRRAEAVCRRIYVSA